MHLIEEEKEILRLIGRFANSFDLKDWSTLENCLAETLYTDYSDLRGTPPEVISRSQFVRLRRKALERLKTHHLTGNYEISVEAGRGECRVSMTIWRKTDDGRVLNTHCLYLLVASKSERAWRISSIIQKVLWSDGDSSIHSGIVKD